MIKAERKRDWSDLISAINDDLINFDQASIALKQGLNDFKQLLETEKIALANENPSGMIWQAKSLLKCLFEIIDPILEVLIPNNSNAHYYLQQNKISLPLSKHIITKEALREHAEKIKAAKESLEALIPDPNHINWSPISTTAWDKSIEDGENLELLASIFYRIFQALDQHTELNWCSLCFRRTYKNAKYCKSHFSHEDTNYHRGKRIKNSMPDDISSKWNRHRTLRKSLGDQFTIFSTSSDVPEVTTFNMLGVYLDPQLKTFIEETMGKSWAEAHKYWAEILSLLPLIEKKLTDPPSAHANWDAFRKDTLKKLENLEEKTKHPYWIFMMLVEAQDWFELENQHTDKRLTDNKDKILGLINHGMSDASIARQLGISRSYVGRIRKKYN